MTCGFLALLAGNPTAATCADAVGVKSERHDSLPPSPEGCLKRAKQRANGARLRATPTDSRRQSPQVDGSPGDARRRRNTQKIWFASRRPGVRVPLAPQVRGLIRRKVTGRTKTEVRDKLKKLQAEADAGLKTSASYTVAKAVDDWAAEALDGLAAKTVRSHADLLRPVTMLIGNIPLRDLTAQRCATP